MSLQTVPGDIRPVGYEQLTGLSEARTLQAVPSGTAAPNLAVIQAEGREVRYRDDGTKPTKDIGMILAAGDDFIYFGDLTKICFIDGASPNAKVNVSYYRTG